MRIQVSQQHSAAKNNWGKMLEGKKKKGKIQLFSSSSFSNNADFGHV